MTMPSGILGGLSFGVTERVSTVFCGPEEAGATPDRVTSNLSSTRSRALHSIIAPCESLRGLDSGIPWTGYTHRISVNPALPVLETCTLKCEI